MAQRPALVALLGSSNLSVALPAAVRHLSSRFRNRVLSVLVAYGPGRSYEIDRGSLGIKFTSLSRCELLAAFERAREEDPSSDAYALLTDIGNDLMHGVPAATLAGRVRSIVERFRGAGARVAVTSLPTEGIAALSPGMFHFARTLVYPTSRATHDEVVSNVGAVQEELRQMDSRREIELLPAHRAWYSPDACHIRPAHSGEAFREWIDGLVGVDDAMRRGFQPGAHFSKEALYLHCRPAYRFFRRNGRRHDARPFAITPRATVRAF